MPSSQARARTAGEAIGRCEMADGAGSLRRGAAAAAVDGAAAAVMAGRTDAAAPAGAMRISSAPTASS